MRLPILFLTFIWFCLWLGIKFRSNRSKADRAEQSFWDKEREADFARVRPLDDLAYVTVDLNALPYERLIDDAVAQDAAESIRALAKERIVNLTGISNTDLKLQYGAANLEALSSYDQNFTALVTALQKWARALLDAVASSTEELTRDLHDDARTLLEYAVSVGTDISASYRDLADLYIRTLPRDDARTQIEALLKKAEGLNSMTKSRLVQDLQAHLVSLS